MSHRPHVAFNPLTWFFTQDGTYDPAQAPPLADIYRKIKSAGFDAVHAEPPEGMPVADYRHLLDDTGLAPAPGYFQALFVVDDSLTGALEQAKRVAGYHATLGLSRIFIADQFGVAAPRLSNPAVGAGFDADRLARITDNLGAVASAMAAEGVLPCLHPHVGTWIETPDEAEAVLAGTDPEALLFGPDTGHLAWAGADPVEFIERHLNRVGAVHLKDMRAAISTASRTRARDYQQTAAAHLWTEPGRGDVDFDAVLKVLSGFDGWYVVEVDIADQPTPEDTAAASAHWVHEQLGRTDGDFS